MSCAACGSTYDSDDDLALGIPTHDEDWRPADGKCYRCYLDGIYEIYGGFMEPVFSVGGKLFSADGEIS